MYSVIYQNIHSLLDNSPTNQLAVSQCIDRWLVCLTIFAVSQIFALVLKCLGQFGKVH